MSERHPSNTTPYYTSTTKASKTSISCEASATFPQFFKEQASKTSISCDASSNFHRMRLPNERLARCCRQFSQKKLLKGLFPARFPPNFTEEASKTSAADNLHEKFAFRSNFAQSTYRFLRKLNRHTASCESCERVRPLKAKCASHSNAVHSQMTMHVSPQHRAQKCMYLSTVNRSASRTQKCEVLLQFWAMDTTFLPRGLTESKWNLRFVTILGDRHHVFCERVDR